MAGAREALGRCAAAECSSSHAHAARIQPPEPATLKARWRKQNLRKTTQEETKTRCLRHRSMCPLMCRSMSTQLLT